MPQRDTDLELTERRALGYLIKVLAQYNYRRLQLLLAPFDLTPFHFLVLYCLWKENGLTVSDIPDRLHEVGGTMTGVLDRMEERRLVSRVRDPADRRVLRVFLTKRGQDLKSDLMPLSERSRKAMAQGVSAKDLATFERVAEQLIVNCRQLCEPRL